MSAPFLMWYDDNPKLPMASKIADAIGAYRSRWPSSAPTLVLVNEEEVTEVAGVEVRGVTTVRRNNVWVGLDPRRLEAEKREPVEEPGAQVVQLTETKRRRRKAGAPKP